MKILYAIQGTGNGHLSRARDIIPVLTGKGDLDLLISGTQADIDLPYTVKYRFKGLSFSFGKHGGIDLLETYKKSNLRRLLSEINSLPIENYDLVISDFEPVASWACYLKGKECISLSHQAGVLNKHVPQPGHTDMIGKALLKYYAPSTTAYGFHFKAYDKRIFTPVIRSQVRELRPANKGHYTVYLPAYDDQRIIKVLGECTSARWQVFSKHNRQAFVSGNVAVFPISNEAFVSSMGDAAGVLCGAGFETPAEALYLGKKLMVIPMKNQYEQYCNAAALQAMGVPVLKSLKIKHVPWIRLWVQSGCALTVNYPDITRQIIDDIIDTHTPALSNTPHAGVPGKEYSLKQFRKVSLKKILAYIAG